MSHAEVAVKPVHECRGAGYQERTQWPCTRTGNQLLLCFLFSLCIDNHNANGRLKQRKTDDSNADVIAETLDGQASMARRAGGVMLE